MVPSIRSPTTASIFPAQGTAYSKRAHLVGIACQGRVEASSALRAPELIGLRLVLAGIGTALFMWSIHALP
jgi:hypothetical protein